MQPVFTRVEGFDLTSDEAQVESIIRALLNDWDAAQEMLTSDFFMQVEGNPMSGLDGKAFTDVFLEEWESCALIPVEWFKCGETVCFNGHLLGILRETRVPSCIDVEVFTKSVGGKLDMLDIEFPPSC